VALTARLKSCPDTKTAERRALTPRGKASQKNTVTPPLFFVTAHSKGVMARLSVSADSKGLICTKIVQNLGVLGTAHSKGLSRIRRGIALKGGLKVLILKEQSAQKQKRLRRTRGATLYRDKHSTFLKIVKRNILLLSYPFERGWEAIGRARVAGTRTAKIHRAQTTRWGGGGCPTDGGVRACCYAHQR
jgi:hypothetical protein